MELNKACNNLNNIEQIDSELSNFVEVTKKYEGINTDNIELTVDNNKNQIYANISQVQYNSKLEFPSVGSEKLIYVDLAENSLWRFDKDSSQYICVGRDYTQIQSKAFSTISDMVLELNSYSNTELKVATNLYIQSLDVPDFWVYSVEETNVQYVYTSDNDLISEINNNGSIQIGYYKISKLETGNYYTKEETNELIDNAKGIIQLIGTEDNPVNLYTDTEIGQVYSVSGWVWRKPNRTSNTAKFQFPFIDGSDDVFFFKRCSSSIGTITNLYLSSFELGGSNGNSGTSISFNTNPNHSRYVLGEIVSYANFSAPSFNGTGSQAKQVSLVYAPITSGTAGQILQSNGANNAPTWINMPSTLTETLTIESTSWSELSDSSPYTYSATVTATTTIGTDSIVELINNQPVLFATYGFAIGSISGQVATIYSIGQPSTSVTLTVGVTG